MIIRWLLLLTIYEGYDHDEAWFCSALDIYSQSLRSTAIASDDEPTPYDNHISPLPRPTHHLDRRHPRCDLLLLNPSQHHRLIQDMPCRAPHCRILSPRRIQTRAPPAALPARSGDRARISDPAGGDRAYYIRESRVQLPRPRRILDRYGGGPIRR